MSWPISCGDESAASDHLYLVISSAYMIYDMIALQLYGLLTPHFIFHHCVTFVLFGG